ncbi:MAG: small subunit ribosomal protein, partial [Solirubrobacteraceae bacterium]|nr:small subunit ribosomal protein [Solirubrobacteraceae bacterium]
PHHVENPREIVAPGDEVKVKILEIDSERRRLSLSVKRVEGQVLEPKVLPPEELAAMAAESEGAEHDQGAGDLDDVPQLGLSEEVFAGEDQEVPAGDAAAAEPAEAIAGTDAEAGVDEAVATPVAPDPEPEAQAAAPEPEAAADEPEAVEPDAGDPAAAEADETAAT